MKVLVLSVLVGGVLLASCTPCAEKPTHWAYSGEDEPENWVKLSPKYTGCDGKNQSPIDLTGFISATLNSITFDYKVGGIHEILNNGHTVQVNYATDSSISVEGIQYRLQQFHFHVPGENRINNKPYDMEAHLVHEDKYGNKAVIALMFTEGDKDNLDLAKIWSDLPKDGKTIKLNSPFNVRELLPENHEYYRYNGSLTTPPCTEGVLWLVLKQSLIVSHNQIATLLKVMHHPNNRPPQPVNARAVLQ